MVTAVQLAAGWTAAFRFPAELTFFLPFHVVQTGFGAHPASYEMGTGVSFSEGKAAKT
jgi:hypothetical protein